MQERLKIYCWFLTLVSAGLVGFNLLNEAQFSWGADEGYYYTFVSFFAKEGFACFPKLINMFWADSQLQWYPTPSRLGYIIPAGMLFKLWPSMAALGLFSFICYSLALYVNHHFALKILKDRSSAYIMTAVLASSPLLMAMGRRALTEELLFLLWISILWLCTDYALNKERRHLGPICALFIWALMVKESSFILLPFIIMSCVMGHSSPGRPWRQITSVMLALVLGVFLVPGMIVGFELWAKHLVSLSKLGGEAVMVNPYVRDYCQGPWFRYIVDALLLSPIVTLIAIGFTGHMLLSRGEFKLPYWWLFFFVLVYLGCTSLQMNVRYVISLEAVYALFAALALTAFLGRFNDERLRQRVGALLVSAIVVVNWAFFYNIFVVRGLLDPISSHLLMLQQFIRPY